VIRIAITIEALEAIAATLAILQAEATAHG
jgi:hypothetical protein